MEWGEGKEAQERGDICIIMAYTQHCKAIFLQLKKKTAGGTSQVVQWLRLHDPNAGSLGLISGQGTGAQMPKLSICLPR